jgi:hypothetical protein
LADYYKFDELSKTQMAALYNTLFLSEFERAHGADDLGAALEGIPDLPDHAVRPSRC